VWYLFIPRSFAIFFLTCPIACVPHSTHEDSFSLPQKNSPFSTTWIIEESPYQLQHIADTLFTNTIALSSYLAV
jgi:hypothetical protein